MPRPTKSAPLLNANDISIKRLIEFNPCTIADIVHILQLTTAQVKASLEKLEHPLRNDVFHITHTNQDGRRNYYFPQVSPDRRELAATKRQIIDALSERWAIADDKPGLLIELDKRYKVLYKGVAGLANSRKDPTDDAAN